MNNNYTTADLVHYLGEALGVLQRVADAGKWATFVGIIEPQNFVMDVSKCSEISRKEFRHEVHYPELARVFKYEMSDIITIYMVVTDKVDKATEYNVDLYIQFLEYHYPKFFMDITFDIVTGHMTPFNVWFSPNGVEEFANITLDIVNKYVRGHVYAVIKGHERYMKNIGSYDRLGVVLKVK